MVSSRAASPQSNGGSIHKPRSGRGRSPTSSRAQSPEYEPEPEPER